MQRPLCSDPLWVCQRSLRSESQANFLQVKPQATHKTHKTFIIIITIYFENVNSYHTKLRLRRLLLKYKVFPHIPKNCPFRLQIKQSHVTMSPALAHRSHILLSFLTLARLAPWPPSTLLDPNNHNLTNIIPHTACTQNISLLSHQLLHHPKHSEWI